ncbi:hypothetical protein [Sphingobacterium psychroaquaticum]|uniref:Uncharacterized protein n=2 Tax=Sphingobacterium psychroaquaticum TaxID=561061 RepID=A0A1X7J4S4_9SPHI|nr:hypothetical protein [Sphingobacterium psychroaquaticum]SMG22468.1 hypothetical protein SAMN05660862_1431 [Sphingobacterium psychroaquaticum]
MLNSIQQKNLIASIKEFWSFNRKTILYLPLTLIVLYGAYLLSPTKFIYQIIETPSLGNDEQFLVREMTSGLGHMRGIILLLPFIFLFVCTSRYLFRVKKHSRYTTMPISDLHRIITLWFFTFVIMTIGNLTFYVLDLSTVSIFKLLFMEKTTLANIEVGILYPTYSQASYFKTLDPIYYAFPLIFFQVIPLYQIAHFLFKKNSLFYSILLYTLVMAITFFLYLKWMLHQGNITTIRPENILIGLLPVFIVIGLYLVTFRYLLKEREV